MNSINPILFYFLSALIVLSALGIVFSRDLIHSALLLALCFIGVGSLYATLDADFLAAVQIMVYAGTVVVLIALGIMMTHQLVVDKHTKKEDFRIIGRLIVPIVLFIVLMYAVSSASLPQQILDASADTVSGIARLLLGQYALGFEIAAVLLLSALVGAVVLAKGADEK